jgi:hypothetical protein
MLDSERREIVLSIFDPVAADTARQVCEALRLAYHALPPGWISDPGSLHAGAMIFDGEPLANGPSALRQLRMANPALPIIGFPPMHMGVVPFLTAVGETPAAFATGYWKAPSDRARLEALLQRVLKLSPSIAVMQALEVTLPAHGSVKPAEVAAAVLKLRLDASHVSTDSVALALGVGARSLRKHWPHTFGTPKSFFDTVTLLLALYLRCWTKRGWGTIAAELGTTERALRRLRDGLPSAREAALEQGYRVFADTCSAPPGAIARGLELLFEHTRDPLHGHETDPPFANHGPLH